MTEPSVAGERRVLVAQSGALHLEIESCAHQGCTPAPEAEAAAFRAKMGEKG